MELEHGRRFRVYVCGEYRGSREARSLAELLRDEHLRIEFGRHYKNDPRAAESWQIQDARALARV